jgi:hypothetical protein
MRPVGWSRINHAIIIGGRIRILWQEYFYLHTYPFIRQLTHVQSIKHVALPVECQGRRFVIFDVRRYENNTKIGWLRPWCPDILFVNGVHRASSG